MKTLHLHTVESISDPIRFIDYAQGFDLYKVVYPSRQGLKKAIEKGAFYIDNEKANTGTWIKEGQKIEWIELIKPKTKSYQLDLEVVFEDEYMAVVVKPAGILVSGNQFKTLSNALSENLNVSNEPDALNLPRTVHRLDRLTSGLMLVAKTSRAQIHLSNQFKNKSIQKRYRAIVKGVFPKELIVQTSIEGQEASSRCYNVACYPSIQNGNISLVDLYPETGRTHQLRIHTSGQGHPIIGDALYTKEGEVLKGKGLFLSAVGIQFIHPIKGVDMKFEIDQPYKFDSLIEREERRWNKFKSDKDLPS